MKVNVPNLKLVYGNPQDLIKMINQNSNLQKESSKSVTQNLVHITDGFMCKGCFKGYEKENLSTSMNRKDNSINDDCSFEEDLDMFGYDLNPNMEEETKCIFCLKKRKEVPAVCLVEGNPSCVDCSLKKQAKLQSKEEVNLNLSAINQLLNDSTSAVLNISHSEVKPGGFLKRTNTIANFKNGKSALKNKRDSINMPQPTTPSNLLTNNNLNSSKIGLRNKFSIDFSAIKEDNESPVKITSRIQKPSISLNLNKINDLTNNTGEAEEPKTNKPYFTEYTHKEIDNKIMSLVSPRTSIDLKYRKSINYSNQVDNLSKSLNHIFEKINFQNLSINLPPIIQTSNSEKINLYSLSKSLNSSGNYLFILLNDKKEFLFGFLYYVSTLNKVGKFFKKNTDQNSSDIITYYDTIYEEVKAEKNLIFVKDSFSFDFQTFKFVSESGKLMKFLFNPENKTNLYSSITFLDIYDMC